MFGRHFWGARYYGPAYWGDGGNLAPAVVAVTGGGIHLSYGKGERRKRGLEWDEGKRDRRAELEAVYRRIAGELPAAAAAPVLELVQPFVAPAASFDTALPPVAAVDWLAFMADLGAVEALLAVYRALTEEEEDAVIALLMA